MNGEHARAASLLARLFEAMPAQTDFGRRALGEAMDSGQFDLALALARKVPGNKLAADVRLLVVADELKHRRADNAAAWLTPNGDGSDLSFLKPIVLAWGAADRGDVNGALQTIAAIPNNSPLASFKSEEAAFILLKFGRTADAEAFARRTIGNGGIRETHLRIALASGFLAARDRARAAAMLDGISPEAANAAADLLAGKIRDQQVDDSSKAFSEVLTALAGDVVRLQRNAPPLGLAQVARYANPTNSAASVLLALVFDIRHRPTDALAVLAQIPPTDPLISQARDAQVRVLSSEKRFDEALAIATAAASQPRASAADHSRLGDVYSAMKRNAEAAAAYGRAVAATRASGNGDALWSFYLLQASALQDAGRWPEAKAALEQGLSLSPQQPLLLNFLGYAKLERGEDMDKAEAMIRRASELAPEDASITDSLGWAQFKRGKVAEAIDTLQKAAEKDPDQAEIHEHLGDALYTQGRRYEARYAWAAALITAEDEVAKRINAKIKTGLNPGNAAP